MVQYSINYQCFPARYPRALLTGTNTAPITTSVYSNGCYPVVILH